MSLPTGFLTPRDCWETRALPAGEGHSTSLRCSHCFSAFPDRVPRVFTTAVRNTFIIHRNAFAYALAYAPLCFCAAFCALWYSYLHASLQNVFFLPAHPFFLSGSFSREKTDISQQGQRRYKFFLNESSTSSSQSSAVLHSLNTWIGRPPDQPRMSTRGCCGGGGNSTAFPSLLSFRNSRMLRAHGCISQSTCQAKGTGPSRPQACAARMSAGDSTSRIKGRQPARFAAATSFRFSRVDNAASDGIEARRAYKCTRRRQSISSRFSILSNFLIVLQSPLTAICFQRQRFQPY
jgi:hypothetical protein